MRSDLHVFAARANPLRWHAPDRIYKDWAEHMLDSGVTLHVVECQYGDRAFTCALPHVDHIGVRASTMVWSKENLLRIGMMRNPEARKIVWSDADVFFRKPGWADDVIAALDLYDFIQPWTSCYDLGPNDEHLTVHKSFCSLYHQGKPVVPMTKKWWVANGGQYDYAHCLLGDTLVVPGGQVRAASSRPFEGDVVVIRTVGGQELSCTPNHPILSGGQWVRADSLNVGDYVLSHVRGNGVVGKPDEKHPPARIEDVVRAFGERAGMHRSTNPLPDDLDNNRANSKVAEVWADRLLTAELTASRSQKNGDSVFGDVGVGAAQLGSVGALDLLFKGLGLAASSYKAARAPTHPPKLWRGLGEHTIANQPGDLVSTGLGIGSPPELVGFAASPQHTSLLEPVPCCGRVHADNPGSLRAALSGQVEFDEIVYIGRREFRGQVYDLKTEHGYIIADGIVTHNSGFCWGVTRQALDWVGGLFEVGGMGSGDYHMALGLIGQIDKSVIAGASQGYLRHLHLWQDRAVRHVNYNIGYTNGTIEHRFHGRKGDRQYIPRWEMFLRHGFDPDVDLKRNTYGVLEWAGNKPDLRREFDRYLRSRQEDVNSLA
jgi:hypothetical protein